MFSAKQLFLFVPASLLFTVRIAPQVSQAVMAGFTQPVQHLGFAERKFHIAWEPATMVVDPGAGSTSESS